MPRRRTAPAGLTHGASPAPAPSDASRPVTSIAPRAQSRWNRGGAGDHIIAVWRSSAFQITFRGYRRGAQRRVPPAHVVLLNAATAPPAGKPPRRRSGHRSVIWSAPLLSGRSRATLERSKVDGDAPNLSRCRTAAGASTATHQLLSVRPVPAGDVDRTANAKPLEPGRGGGAHHCCSALQRIPDNVSRLPTWRAAPCPAGPSFRAWTSLHPAGEPPKAAKRSPLRYLECASRVLPQPCTLERSQLAAGDLHVPRCRTAPAGPTHGASPAPASSDASRPVNVHRTASAKPLEPGRGGGAHHCCSALQRIPDNVWRLPTRPPAPRPAGPCSQPTTSLHPAGKPLKAAQRPPLCYPECAPPPPAEGGRGPELSADKRFDSGRALDAADTGTMRPAPHQLLPREPGVPGSSIAPVPRNRWIRGGEGNKRFTPQRTSAFRITFPGERRRTGGAATRR